MKTKIMHALSACLFALLFIILDVKHVPGTCLHAHTYIKPIFLWTLMLGNEIIFKTKNNNNDKN